jgi:adenylate cyclase
MAAARVDRRLIEQDEAGTVERLKQHRKAFIEPLIAEHRGRIVKLMGDGALCEFGSVVDAVQCAVLIQHGMAEREADTPEDQRIRLRVGINLGDVIFEALWRWRQHRRPPGGSRGAGRPLHLGQGSR